MISKPQRVKDPKAIQRVRKSYCEWCGRPAFGLPHHIYTVGAGGPDIPGNMIQLCGFCHAKAHNGKLKRGLLLEIVAKREGRTVEEIEEIIRENRGRAISGGN